MCDSIIGVAVGVGVGTSRLLTDALLLDFRLHSLVHHSQWQLTFVFTLLYEQQKVSIRAGDTYHDLEQVRIVCG